MEVEEIQLLFCKAGHFQSRAGYRVSLETPINCISVTGAQAGQEFGCSSTSATWNC